VGVADLSRSGGGGPGAAPQATGSLTQPEDSNRLHQKEQSMIINLIINMDTMLNVMLLQLTDTDIKIQLENYSVRIPVTE
jgi:hypothetical protein